LKLRKAIGVSFHKNYLAQWCWIPSSQRAIFSRRKILCATESHILINGGISKIFRTGRLERELQMVQLPATRCSCIAILSVSIVSFAVITLCAVSQRVFIVYFVIDSVRKLLDTPSYVQFYSFTSSKP
jgi:hypothetical protein